MTASLLVKDHASLLSSSPYTLSFLVQDAAPRQGIRLPTRCDPCPNSRIRLYGRHQSCWSDMQRHHLSTSHLPRFRRPLFPSAATLLLYGIHLYRHVFCCVSSVHLFPGHHASSRHDFDAFWFHLGNGQFDSSHLRLCQFVENHSLLPSRRPKEVSTRVVDIDSFHLAQVRQARLCHVSVAGSSAVSSDL